MFEARGRSHRTGYVCELACVVAVIAVMIGGRRNLNAALALWKGLVRSVHSTTEMWNNWQAQCKGFTEVVYDTHHGTK
jgi:GH15 family glucan-1,4-alpha-glucosidase